MTEIWSASRNSAGTSAFHVGEPPHKEMISIGVAKGYSLTGLRSRQVTELDFFNFSHIVAMDESNKFDLESMAPKGATAKISMLLNFIDSVDINVPDPYYGGKQGFLDCFSIIEDGIGSWALKKEQIR